MQQIEIFSEVRYVIDTSSLVDIRLEQDPAAVWRGMYRLVASRRLFTVAYVFPELERMVAVDKLPEQELQRLKELKPHMIIPDDEIILETGRINFKYPKLGDWRDRRNRADPWIVAAGLVRGYTVVTEENDTGAGKTHRIPWACDQEGVKWSRLGRLISHEKLLD